jgi:hypothetical protein
MRSRLFWLDFSAVAAPFFLLIIYYFGVTGKTYFDFTADISLHYWIAMAIGWDLSEWPFLLHNATGGFREHHPAIPHEQIAAIVGKVFGWPTKNLQNWADLGVGLFLFVVVVCSMWTAAISHQLGGLPRMPLFCAAVFAASQPAMTFVWSSYGAICVMAIPIGTAIWAVANGWALSRPNVLATFGALGFSLAVLYISGMSIAALVVAGFFALLTGDQRIYKNLLLHPISKTYVFLSALLFLIFAWGFASVAAHIPQHGADLIRSLSLPRSIVAGIGIVATLIGGAALWTIVGRIHQSDSIRFSAITIGTGLIGWGLGVNLLALSSWHAGLIGAMELRGSGTVSHWLTSFLTTTPRPWLLSIPVLFVIGAAMAWRALKIDNETVLVSRFASVFILTLVAINILALPQMSSTPSILQSADGFGYPRYAVCLTVAVPLALFWCHQLGNKRISWTVNFVFVALAVLSMAEYHRYMAPVSIHENAISKFAAIESERFLHENPNGIIVCSNYYIGQQCEIDFTYKLYRNYHDADVKNRPLPKFTRPRQKRVLKQSQNCPDIYSCLNIVPASGIPILFLTRDDPMPAGFRKTMKPWQTLTKPPEGIWLWSTGLK